MAPTIGAARRLTKQQVAMLCGAMLYVALLYGWGIYILLTILGLFGLIVAHQGKLLYMPQPDAATPRSNAANPKRFRSPEEWGMPFEALDLRAKDGVRISAWYIHQPDAAAEAAAPTVIYFHGNAGNIGGRLISYHTLWSELGLNILAVEYRGYGDSDDANPTEATLCLDADAALRWLQLRGTVDQSRVFLFGRSLGGAVAISLAARAPFGFRGVMVENTFLSIDAIARRLLPFLKYIPPFLLHYCLISRWRSCDDVRRVRAPLLLLSGLDDELIPPAHMAKLHAIAREGHTARLQAATEGEHGTREWIEPELVTFEGGHHNDTWQKHGYVDALRAFIDRALQQDVVPSLPGDAAASTGAPSSKAD